MTDAKDVDQIREEIESTRAELAQTVDALSAKLDVKAQAKHRVDELSARTKPYRVQIAAGVAAVAVLVVVRKVRHRGQGD